MTIPTDALSAFDNAEFASTKDRRNSYTGEIPDSVQKFVDTAIENGKVGFLPLSAEQQEDLTPVIAAAAKLRGKSARIWTKFGPKDENGADGPRLGTNVSVGKARTGRPASNGSAPENAPKTTESE